MKTYRIFGIALVTGTEKELGWVEALAYGDYQLTKMRPEDVRKMEGGGYHVHRNQKGGPRKPKYLGPMEALRGSNSEDRNLDGTPFESGVSGTGQEAPHASD